MYESVKVILISDQRLVFTDKNYLILFVLNQRFFEKKEINGVLLIHLTLIYQLSSVHISLTVLAQRIPIVLHEHYLFSQTV